MRMVELLNELFGRFDEASEVIIVIPVNYVFAWFPVERFSRQKTNGEKFLRIYWNILI